MVITLPPKYIFLAICNPLIGTKWSLMTGLESAAEMACELSNLTQ
jgi:hypothetical protein